jgi:hypothetical protein
LQENIRLQDIKTLSDSNLIELYVDEKQQLDNIRERISYIEFVIHQKMEKNNAKIMRNSSHEVEKKAGTSTFDPSVLRQLFEHFSEDELIEQRIYYPQHEETITVPEKFNMGKGRVLKKHGQHVADIIDSARIEGKSKFITREVTE